VNIKISYHPTYDTTEEILTVEAQFVHTRGIGICSVLTNGTGNGLIIYTNGKPARIDRQGDTVFLLGRKFAEEYTKPFQLFKDTESQGTPTTLYRD